MGMLIDGVDTESLGLVVEDISGRLSSVSFDVRTEQMPLLDYSLFVAPGVAQSRRIMVRGTLVAATRNLMMTNRDAILALLRNGLLDVVFPDVTTRFYRGYVVEVDVDPIPPVYLQRGLKLSFQLMCAFPYAIATTDTVVVFTGSGAYAPLGTAPSRGKVEIAGPATNPVLVYYTSAMVERARMAFTRTLTGGQKLVIDLDKETIVDQAGANAMSSLTGVNSVFFRLNPYDAGGTGGPGAILTVSAGTGTATYRQAWL